MDALPPCAPTDPVRTALLDRMLEEAACLGEEARDHIGRRSAGIAPEATLRIRHEIGVIATCLGYSVAWLLEQKAVLAGEIAGASPTPLAVHANATPPDAAEVGLPLADLGRRTRAFGRRIHRLAAH